VLHVFIADDEAPARARLRELLEDIMPEAPTQVVGEARNGVETIERLPQSGADVLLLDIEMPGMHGLEVARHLTRLSDAPAVIFVTAHDRHAVDAFELNALDYLLKPVRSARLAAALKRAAAIGAPSAPVLERAAEQVRQTDGRGRSHFSLAERNRIVLVPVADVVYLKADQKYVTLRTREREHLIDESLASLEGEFGEMFVRIHRNCIVARNAVRGFERAPTAEDEEAHWLVVLEGVPERLPVSRRQWSSLRALVAQK